MGHQNDSATFRVQLFAGEPDESPIYDSGEQPLFLPNGDTLAEALQNARSFGAARLASLGAKDEAGHFAAERAAATDAGAREAEDRMDAYLTLLEKGTRPAEVLCRAAMRRLPPAQFYGATATWLEARGGITTREHKGARKLVKRWVEDGLPVPAHCWALLLSAIPASVLKERLGDLGGRQ
jgi:hypothetical protein